MTIKNICYIQAVIEITVQNHNELEQKQALVQLDQDTQLSVAVQILEKPEENTSSYRLETVDKNTCKLWINLTLAGTDSHLSKLSLDHQLLNQTYRNTPVLQKALSQLQQYFSGELKTFDIELAVEGTQFQKQVWQALQNISYGKTASYGAIAKTVQNPKAVRAVGGANNKNPIAIIVPCHRIISSTGKLTGYAYGTDFKSFLLDLERAKS